MAGGRRVAGRAGEAAAAEPLRPAQEVDVDRTAVWLRALASPVRLRLLRYLAHPHYMEEVASHLKVSRQAALKQTNKLVDAGLVERRAGRRETGPVLEYVVSPSALFVVLDELEKLGSLGGEPPAEAMVRTLARAGARYLPRPEPGPCLWMLRGPAARRRVPLARNAGASWSIGRDDRCSIMVAHDPFASNRHAEIRSDGKEFLLTDLRSTNGTEYNFAELPRGAEVTLRHGDLLAVGKTLMVFWDPSPPTS